MSCLPVCTPKLLEELGPRWTPDDLRRHVLLHDEAIDRVAAGSAWRLWLKAAGATGVDTIHGPRFSNNVLALEAAAQGLGVAMALRPLVDVDIASGKLVAPSSLAVELPSAYYLVAPEVIAERPSVRAFRDWLLEEARDESCLGAVRRKRRRR